MANEATRQHHKLATGEKLQESASGPDTRERYAKGGHVKEGVHGHGSHGHQKGVPGHGTHGHKR